MNEGKPRAIKAGEIDFEGTATPVDIDLSEEIAAQEAAAEAARQAAKERVKTVPDDNPDITLHPQYARASGRKIIEGSTDKRTSLTGEDVAEVLNIAEARAANEARKNQEAEDAAAIKAYNQGLPDPGQRAASG